MTTTISFHDIKSKDLFIKESWVDESEILASSPTCIILDRTSESLKEISKYNLDHLIYQVV